MQRAARSVRIILFGCLLVLALFELGCDRNARPRMVDAGGYSLRALIEGGGSPSVVFVSPGFGASLEAWERVQPTVSQFARTFSYDRGGTYKSDPAPLPRDSRHIADELHAALQNARLKPPYIVVGASVGGIHARTFAEMYPSDVAGLVLVDPTPEDMDRELKARNPRMWQKSQEQLGQMAQELAGWSSGAKSEFEMLNTDYDEVRNSGMLPDVPITLISANHAGSDIENSPGAILEQLQHQFIQGAPKGRLIKAARSGHNVAQDQPDVVIEAIRAVATSSRESSRRYQWH